MSNVNESPESQTTPTDAENSIPSQITSDTSAPISSENSGSTVTQHQRTEETTTESEQAELSKPQDPVQPPGEDAVAEATQETAAEVEVTEEIVAEVEVEATQETAADTEIEATQEIAADTEGKNTAEESEDLEKDEAEEDDGLDYASMPVADLLAYALKVTETEADLGQADRKMKQMREVISAHNQTEKNRQKEAFMAQEGANEIDFRYNQPKEFEQFYELHKQLKAKRKKQRDELIKNREDNLAKKKDIIAQIKVLLDDAEGQGSLEKIKSLQKTWKEIGAVPKTDADDLYKTYNALLDIFYDNKSIEYDLKELDRKKNLEIKLGLCQKAEDLLNSTQVNEAVRTLNALHEEYRSVGPVPKKEQEALWTRFKEASDKLYQRKREIAEVFKKQLQENMLAKQKLCLALEPFLSFDSDRIKAWNAKTKEILALQDEWQKIGQLPREVAKDINKQFWGNFKQFFANKSAFFEKMDAERKENLVRKQALVKEAEALKESDDWQETADKLKTMQQEWRKIGLVPESHRNSVYAEFKAACDTFFNRKRGQRAEKEKAFVENLRAKTEICEKLKKMAAEKPTELAPFDAAFQAFAEIGFVPRKDMNAILERMLSATDAYFDALETTDLDKEARDKKRISYKAELLKSVPNAGRKLEKQQMAIRSKIQHRENDIALWQNNLQFFANSKTADKLRKEFNQKIQKAQKTIDTLKEQLRILRSINEKS